jgi:hypothetical protein
MGVASYGWWGSKRYWPWRADHALMEVGALCLRGGFPLENDGVSKGKKMY